MARAIAPRPSAPPAAISASSTFGPSRIRPRQTARPSERFIQTALREWASAQAYPTSDHRAAAFPIWLHRYNRHRPHSSLQSKAPITRLALTEDNLLSLHI